MIIISGESGLGKTELVKSIVNNQREGCGLVWQSLDYPENDLNIVKESLIAFGASELGLERIKPDEFDSNIEYLEIFNARLKAKLLTQHLQKIIFVFDNFDDHQNSNVGYTQTNDFIHFLAECIADAYFIFTSQKRFSHIIQSCYVFDLSGFSSDFIHIYIKTNLPERYESLRPHISNIKIFCNNNPKVLHLISPILKRINWQQDLLFRSEPYNDYSIERYKVVNIHLRTICESYHGSQNNEDYESILDLVAILPSGGLPYHFLEEIENLNGKTLINFSYILELSSYNIVDFDYSFGEDPLISMHEIIRKVWLSKREAKITTTYEAALDYFLDKLPGNYLEIMCDRKITSWDLMEIFYRCLKNLVYIGSDHNIISRKKLCESHHKLAVYLTYVEGDFKESCEHFRRAIEIVEHEDSEALLRATLYGLYADSLYRDGHLKEAVQYMKDSIRLLEEMNFSESSKNLGFNLHALGNIFYNSGLYNHAELVLQKSEKIRNILHAGNPGHIEYGLLYHDLGNVYICLGNYGQATRYFKRAKSIKTEYYGRNDKNSPNLALLYERYAEVAIHLLDFDRAKKRIDKALKIYRIAYKGFGDHIDILRCESLLADISFRRSFPEEAINKLDDLIERARRQFGAQTHRKVIELIFKKLSIYRTCQIEAGSESFITVKQAIQEINLVNHPDKAHFYEQKAWFNIIFERIYQKAELHLQSAKDIKMEYYSFEDVAKNANIAILTLYKGIFLQLNGRYEEAIEEVLVAISLCQEAFSAHHPNLAVCYHELGISKRLYALKIINNRDEKKRAEVLQDSIKDLETAISIYDATFGHHANYYAFLTNFELLATLLVSSNMSHKLEAFLSKHQGSEFYVEDIQRSRWPHFLQILLLSEHARVRHSSQLKQKAIDFVSEKISIGNFSFLHAKMYHENYDRGDVPFMDVHTIHYP